MKDTDFKTNGDFFDSLEVELRPRFLLFLSVDLVGSTPVKQRHYAIDLEDPEDREIDPNRKYFAGTDWFFFVSEFYVRFKDVLRRELGICVEADRLHANKLEADDPSSDFDSLPDRIVRWKLAGDEIIFTVDVYSSSEVALLALAFRNALIVFRKMLYGDREFFTNGGDRYSPYLGMMGLPYDNTKLDVKGTIWSAGFPITNYEVAIATLNGPAEEMFIEEDPDHRNLMLVARSKKQKSNEPVKYILDYIGPSIDTGFRLTSKANPRRLIVSVEVIYLISSVDKNRIRAIADATQIKPGFQASFGGREYLKGVAGGAAYPIFWIEGGSDEGLSVLENKMLSGRGNVGSGKIRRYLDRFFERNRRYIRRPVILSPKDAFKYDSLRIAIKTKDEKWKKAKSALNSRQSIYRLSEDERTPLDD